MLAFCQIRTSKDPHSLRGMTYIGVIVLSSYIRIYQEKVKSFARCVDLTGVVDKKRLKTGSG